MTSADRDALDVIRSLAFAPIFDAFRSLLGDEIYELAQRRGDEAQGALLESLLSADSGWDAYAALVDAEIVGFITIQLNRESLVGEIGLNAVAPHHAGHGVGTAMYRFALDTMREAGMRVAVVGTGGDPSHAAARRAYEKVGFSVAIPSVWMCAQL